MKKISFGLVVMSLLLLGGNLRGLPAKSTAPETISPTLQSNVWNAEIMMGKNSAPAEVVSLTHNSQTVSFDGVRRASFEAASDFLKNASINIKNTSGNTINSIRVDIYYFIPETKKTVTKIHCMAGTDMAIPGSTATLKLAPGEVVSASVPEVQARVFQDAARSVKGTIRIYLSQVTYEGLPDIIWRKGYILRRNPEKPTQFVRPDLPLPAPTTERPRMRRIGFEKPADEPKEFQQLLQQLSGTLYGNCYDLYYLDLIFCTANCFIVDEVMISGPEANLEFDYIWEMCGTDLQWCLTWEYELNSWPCSG